MKKTITVFFILSLINSRSCLPSQTPISQQFNDVKKSILYQHVQKCVAEKKERNFNLLKEELGASLDDFLIKLEAKKLLSIFKKNLSICSTPQARKQAVVDMQDYIASCRQSLDSKDFIRQLEILALFRGNIYEINII